MSSFLRFPLELRYLIYELLLVQESTICIKEISIGTRLSNWGIRFKKRKIWKGNLPTELFSLSDKPNILDRTELDLALTTYTNLNIDSAIGTNLNLFLASRQLYHESRQIFYGQNIFAMDNHNSNAVAVCLGFLQDRPESLQYIRYLELFLGNRVDLPVSIHFPMQFWRPLGDMINNCGSLTCLGLHLFGRLPDVRQLRLGTLKDNSTDDNLNDIKVAEWLQEFIKLESPQNIVLEIRNCHSDEINLAFFAFLDSNMPYDMSSGEVDESLRAKIIDCFNSRKSMTVPAAL